MTKEEEATLINSHVNSLKPDMATYRKSVKLQENEKTMAELIAEAQLNYEDEEILKSLVKWRDLKDNFDPLKATLKYKPLENKSKFT